MFMGLDPWVIWCIVASSSRVRGLGTLQCGIIALVAAWAWMGHERSANRGRLSSAQQESENFKKIWLKISPSAKLVGSSKDWVGKSSDTVECLVRRPPDEGPVEGNSQKFLEVFIGSRQRSVEFRAAVVEGISWRPPKCRLPFVERPPDADHRQSTTLSCMDFQNDGSIGLMITETMVMSSCSDYQ